MKFDKLESGIAALGVFGLLLLIAYFFILSPAMARKQGLETLCRKKNIELTEMLKLQQQWKELRQKRTEAEAVLDRRGMDFTLLTYLEKVSRKLGIDKNLQYIKPISFPESDGPLQAGGIEIRFESLETGQFIKLLHDIEHSENLLHIDKIKIQPVEKEKARLLSLTLQINTYTRTN